MEMPSEPTPNKAKEPEVRYVLSGQPTGWAAMGKEVREFDEEKIRSSKEDIDTLLVFAGLFSAVLSAFLVAAYPSLQVDRMDTVVYTLQVIAAQTAGYNLIGNTITSSTAPPPPLPPFKPAPNDIRVNVLWFASLVISLITASFAMLVKQWLREFLAVEVPSPQARLRIRHFREPQLKQWMVFEIAASLPLLLQLSLALFFVGLCYFTAAIHASIGYTTLPLVVGWALFFFTATSLPIFFPRCPYRTTLLKAAVARLHRALRCMVNWLRNELDNPPTTDTGSETSLGTAESPSLPNTPHHVLTICKAFLRRVLRNMLPDENSLPDEREIVKVRDQDINILISVDAIQANDELLLTVMTEAFHYGRPDWEDAVHFVMQILAHRLPTVAESDRVLVQWPFADAFPLRNLRPQVVEGISKILSEHVALIGDYKTVFPLNPRRATDPHSLCMYSLIIAVADVDIELVTSNPMLLRYFKLHFARIAVDDPLCTDWTQIALGKQTTQNGPSQLHTTGPVGRLLCLMTKLVEPANMSLTAGVRFIQALTATKIDDWGQTIEWNAWSIDDDNLTWSLTSEAFLQALLLSEFKQVSAGFAVNLSSDETGSRVLSVILRSVVRLLEDSSASVLRRHFCLINSMHCLLRIAEVAAGSESCTGYLMGVLLDSGSGGPDGHPNSITLAQVAQQSIAFVSLELSDITIQGVESFKGGILSRCSRISGEGALLHLLRLCQAAMVLFSLVNIPTDGREAVRQIFASFVTPLRSSTIVSANASRHHAPLTKAIGEIAHACFHTMALYHRIDNSNYEKDGPKFSELRSIFPDDLVEILMELDTTESYKSFDGSFFRIRRIKKLRLLGLEQIRELWPDLPEPGVTPAVETTPIVTGEGVDNGPDTGSRGHYNVDGPSNNFTDIHAHEGTARVTANKDSGDDVEHFGPSNVNPSPDVDGHTDVHPAVSPHAYEDSVHEGEAAESVEDDTPSPTRSDRQDNPVAQHNQTPTALDMGLADAVEREETRLLLADIYEHEGTARTTVNEDSKDNVDHPNFSNANNSPDRGSQIGADLAAASPHVPGDATLEHEPAQPADDTLGTTTQARPDDQDGQVAQHGSVSETSSVGANDTAEGVEG